MFIHKLLNAAFLEMDLFQFLNIKVKGGPTKIRLRTATIINALKVGMYRTVALETDTCVAENSSNNTRCMSYVYA